MKIVRTQKELKADIEVLRESGKRIGFVPTMGALHDGHLSLIREAKKYSDAIVVSIFVNPTQFGPKEDFAKYPRQEQDDLAKLKSSDVSIVYLPQVSDIYPDGAAVDVTVPQELSTILCGKSRPHFFHGVATVVKRLFEQVTPDIAIFGEKDYQQLLVIKWLVKEFSMPIEIIGAPIIREPDGLAMSSRNAYLSPEERKLAPEISNSLSRLRERVRVRASSPLLTSPRKREEEIGHAISSIKSTLEQKGFVVDYLEIYQDRIFIAAWLGKTRLIDNLKV